MRARRLVHIDNSTMFRIQRPQPRGTRVIAQASGKPSNRLNNVTSPATEKVLSKTRAYAELANSCS
ncbi:hypothetical protein D3C86_1715190 [compost metagenome]